MTYSISIHLHGEKTVTPVTVSRYNGDVKVAEPVERVDATIKLDDPDVHALIERAVAMLNLTVPPLKPASVPAVPN